MSEETSDKRTSLPVLIPLGLHAKNQPIKLGRPVYVLGAKQHCRIHLVSSTVSNTHAVLVQTRHITYIRDLCSRTHIYVNGDEVKESVLKNGDLLTIGRFQFKYQGPIKDHGAEPAVPPGVLNVAGAETPVPLESRAIVIGRRPTCDVPLLEESVSTIHAVILQWEGQRFIRDLWSRSGTFVNGKAIHEAELKPGDRIKIGETEMTYAPSVDEVAFSLVEGASDSIYADTPAAEEVDFGKEIEPKVTAAQAPLELILTPKSPPPPEELLPLEADETLEATPHDTAHIPLSIEVESTGSKTATPTAVPLGSNFAPTGSKDQPALSSRGWRSSVQDENLPAQDEEPLELEPLAIEIEQDEAPAKPVVPSREVIEPTQPTPESALAMPMAEDSTPQAASGAGELTDTTFGRNVEEFEGESLGPIVESAEPLQVQAVASEPAPVLPGTPSVEEIEPMLMFPVEPAESMAIIDSSAIPVEPAMEPLLEVTPGDETPSLASLAEDVVQPVAEEEPATEIPVLSDSLVPQADAEPEIDLSPMPEKAIDDTPGEEPIAESPLLPLRSPAVEIISPGEVVVEHDDSLEAESAPVSVHVEPAASVSTDLNESLMGQEFGEVEPVRETENVSVPREVLSADVAAPPSDDEAILLEDEIVAEAPEHPIEHEPRLEEISMSPVNVPAHAMVSDPVAVTPDEVEEVMPAPHAEAVVELDTPAIALVPSDVSRVADESFEPVESVATDSISLISDDNNGAPPPVSSGDTGMGMLSAPENEPVLMAQQPAEASPADETVDAAEGMIELSPPENASPVEVEDTIDLSKMTSESVGTPIDDASALDFLTEEAPAEAVTISADSATDGQVTSDHTAADDLGVEAITVTPPEEIPSSPTLESALSNDESGVDLAKLSPKDDADEKIEEPLAIDVAPVETISVSRSDERPLDVEVPEGIPSSPTLESALSRDESGVDLAKLAPKDDAGEKVEEPLAIDVTPMETISVSRSDERPLDVEVPEGIPSSPTLESALARDESSVDLAKFALKDEAGEKIEEPLAVDVTPMETVSVSRSDESPLNIEVPEEIPSSPTLESALGRDESKVDLAKLTPADQIVETVEDAGGDLSAMTGADQSTVPVDESAALDFLTASEPSHEGQATIDESSVEPPPPVVPFPDIKPPVMPAKIAPVSVTPVEIPKLGDVPAVPIMEAPSAEPPADLGFKAIPIPRVGKRGRRGPRARVIRDGFNKGDGASQSGHVEIPPFTEHAAGIAAGESLQGLSQPPVRQADVFSDMAGAAAEVQKDVFSAGSTSEADRLAKEVAKLNADDEFIGKVEAPKRGPEISEKPARASARGVILPGFDLSTPKPAMPVDDPDAAIARRRKLLRRVPVLMTVMILLIGAAWAAAWFLSPMRTRIQATLVFHNFERLTQREQHLTEADQANLLGQEVTRRTAIRMLQNRYPGVSPGFLDNPDQFGTIVSNPETHWLDGHDHAGQFVIRYDGTDPDEDKTRVEAVALAMYDANSHLANDAHSLNATLATLSTNIDTAKRRIEELKQQQDRERAIIDAKPTKDQVDKLKADDADYNAEYNIAITKFKDAQADLKRMTQQAATPTTAPADPTAADTDLAKMSQDAASLTGQIESARKERTAAANKARETLDAAYDDFKKQVEAAQGGAKDNPQLAAYVTAAQNTQQAIRDITDQYIQHQQDEYAELNGLKSDIMAKMQQRKADLMANDPKLKDLNDQKEIATRKLNTAKGQGLDKDAADFQNDIDLLNTAIKAQQEIVSNDPLYNEMITRLQQLIDQKSHTIDVERKKTDERLAEIKSSFNKSAPAVEKMPAEQKQLASAMQDRLGQLDAARRQYAEAANTAAADADNSVKAMTEQLQTLQMNIELRKKQILASSNKPSGQEVAAAIAQQTALVKQLDVARNTAREAYESNQANLRKAQAAVDDAQASAQRLEEANNQRDQLGRQLERNTAEWDSKNALAGHTIEPVEPTPDSVITLGDPVKERRNTIVTYGGFSSVGIFVVFAGWIMLTLLGAARESHESRAPAIEALETPGPGGNVAADENSEAEENEAAVA